MAAYERLNSHNTRGRLGPAGAHNPYGVPRNRRQPGHQVGDQVDQVDAKSNKSKSLAQDDETVEVTGGFSSGKTAMVLAIVAGCFAVLWPKIFVPMIFGEAPHPVKTDDDGELTLLSPSFFLNIPPLLQTNSAEGQEGLFCFGLQRVRSRNVSTLKHQLAAEMMPWWGGGILGNASMDRYMGGYCLH